MATGTDSVRDLSDQDFVLRVAEDKIPNSVGVSDTLLLSQEQAKWVKFCFEFSKLNRENADYVKTGYDAGVNRIYEFVERLLAKEKATTSATATVSSAILDIKPINNTLRRSLLKYGSIFDEVPLEAPILTNMITTPFEMEVLAGGQQYCSYFVSVGNQPNCMTKYVKHVEPMMPSWCNNVLQTTRDCSRCELKYFPW